MDTPAPQSHTHLYIVVGLLVIFAALFFLYSVGRPTPLAETPVQNDTPFELKRLVLSPEQAQKQQASLEAPSLNKSVELTAEQRTGQKKALEAVTAEPKPGN